MRKIYDWLINRPLNDKLNLCYALIMLSAILPILVITTVYEYLTLKKNLLSETQVTASILADSAATAVAFNDRKAAAEVLATLRMSEEIISSTLILPDNTILVSFSKEKENVTLDANFVSGTFTGDYLLVKQPVKLQNNQVGTVLLKSSLKTFHQRLAFYIIAIAISAVIALVLSFWLARLLSKTIAQPIKTLINATEQVIENQDYHAYTTTIESDDEIGRLAQSFGKMMVHIQERDNNMQLMAFFDNVTRLPNRHFFEQRINNAIEAAHEKKARCYLLFIDLDDFKHVNDSLGHDTGDQLLIEVSKRLSGALRHHETVYRLGGDEFAIILEHAESTESAQTLASRLIATLAVPYQIRTHNIIIGASIGISAYPDDANNKTMLVACADKAMYAAKARGKNRFERYQAT